MAQRWAFEEDYVVCKFCQEKEYDDITGRNLDELMDRLAENGFNARSKVAVEKRARDFTYLLRGWESPYAVSQVRMICDMLSNRNPNNELYRGIMDYISENYDPNAPTELNTGSLNGLPHILSEPDQSMHLMHTINKASTFPMVLEKYVVLKKLKKHNAMCKRIGMKPDTFSAILRGKYSEVKKENVLKICVGLELSVSEAEELLNSAGYMLSNAIMTDVVIKAFLWNRIYSVVAINAELYENNAPLLFRDYIIET